MNKKITHFLVVEASNTYDLEQQVRKELFDGWQPFQSWSVPIKPVMGTPLAPTIVHYTSMVKYSE